MKKFLVLRLWQTGNTTFVTALTCRQNGNTCQHWLAQRLRFVIKHTVIRVQKHPIPVEESRDKLQ